MKIKIFGKKSQFCIVKLPEVYSALQFIETLSVTGTSYTHTETLAFSLQSVKANLSTG